MLELPQMKNPSSEYDDVAEKNRKNQSHGMVREDRLSHVEDYAVAQEEWEAVQCIEPILQSPHKDEFTSSPKKFIEGSSSSPAKSLSSSPPALPPNVRVTPHTDFDEVWDFFMRQDMRHVMGAIKPTLERRGVYGFIRSIFGPKKIKPELIDERNLLFAIAQCQFDNSEPIHLQILQTVYKVLTGTKLDCPRYGNHWDVIGFQGVDPATDLRGVGLLGLVQALHLLTQESVLPLARDIFHLSHDPHSQFPLMVLSINVTRISLQTLREGYLNKECNCRSNVRHVLNEFYVAVMFHIYYIWKTECKTIKDSGFLIKDAEAYCKRNVKAVMQKLQSHLRKYSQQEEML
ncbi:ELMO domain-containing protein 3 [Halocaridina rubra]|uniref:ELMO domain-containing protein 3 n=1 Tax=Halocaridina rubra TaxID=373956 RepID=A0AAN8WFP8_HALRR